MKKSNVLLFSNFDLPESNADAIRVFNFAKMLQEQGCMPIIYGVTYDEKNMDGNFEGLNYKLIKLKKSSGIKSIFRTIKMGKNINKELRKIYRDIGLDAIVLSNIYFDCAHIFLKFSKKYNVPLIVNSVEWYDKNNAQFKGKYGPIKLVKNRIALKYLHVKMKNIIAISTLLEKYYKTRNCNVITIPTIIDLKHYNKFDNVHKLNNKVKLCYAGSPARKDLIVNFIYALLQMETNTLNKFEVNLYGFNIESLYKLGITVEDMKRLKNVVYCHGRIPYEKVKDKISESDYTLLVRPQKRYANAGFPTKVGESFACGTPVILNLTSDLDKYMVDMKNAIICKDETVESCKEALIKTLDVKPEDYQKMRKEAYNSAVNCFSYQIYSSLLYNFIRKIN